MKQHVDLQDVFLTKIREDNISITISLINGDEIEGNVEGFDSYTIVLKRNEKQKLIYKHSIATITPLDEVSF